MDKLTIATLTVILLGAGPLHAQDAPQDAPPPPSSDDDPRPEVAGPTVPAGGIVKQAGVGGTTAYGRAGVLELGGAISINAASDFSQIAVTPSVGYFFADNLQMSGLLSFLWAEADDSSGHIVSLLAEPSYHLPVNNFVFGFLGLGVGVAHVDDAGFGFATSPRIGANVLVGRSGILTPSLAWAYTTHETQTGDEGQTLVAVSNAVRFNVGFTVMW